MSSRVKLQPVAVRYREDVWRVSSSSVPGRSYLVQHCAGRYVCDCYAGTSGLDCQHVKLVRNGGNDDNG